MHPGFRGPQSGAVNFKVAAGSGGDGVQVAGVGADDQVAAAERALDDAGIDDGRGQARPPAPCVGVEATVQGSVDARYAVAAFGLLVDGPHADGQVRVLAGPLRRPGPGGVTGGTGDLQQPAPA
jgi:hypothetical protein